MLLYNMCHIIFYNMCHLVLYNIKYFMLHNINYVITCVMLCYITKNMLRMLCYVI